MFYLKCYFVYSKLFTKSMSIQIDCSLFHENTYFKKLVLPNVKQYIKDVSYQTTYVIRIH